MVTTQLAEVKLKYIWISKVFAGSEHRVFRTEVFLCDPAPIYNEVSWLASTSLEKKGHKKSNACAYLYGLPKYAKAMYVYLITYTQKLFNPFFYDLWRSYQDQLELQLLYFRVKDTFFSL